MKTYEIFNTQHGRPIARVKGRIAAKFVATLLHLDYAPKGEGWLQ